MMYALSPGGERISASPGAAGQCALCNSMLTPKCGQIVVWHWAHNAIADCDPWAEPDTHWHRQWQDGVPRKQREVVMGCHRADIVAADKTVIELQRSSIAPADIAERERFYGRMVWLFDAAEPYRDGRLSIRVRRDHRYVTFRWKHPRKSLGCCTRPAWLDLGDGFALWVGRIYTGAPCGGWGRMTSTANIRGWMNGTERLEWWS